MNKYFIVYLIVFISSLKSELLIPEHQDTLSKIHVLFEWEQEPLAIGYNLQISSSEIFDDILLDTNIYDLIYIDKNYLEWQKDYYWRVSSIYEENIFGNWIDTNSFFISNSISNEALNIEIYDQSLIQDRITLFSTWYDEFNIAFDSYGKEIWNSGNTKNFIVHIDKNLEIYGFKYPYNPDDGYYGNNVPMKCDFNNNILKSYEQTRSNRHDLKKLPNGNFLILDDIRSLGPIPLGNWTDEFQNLGYEADGETNEIDWVSQDIVELDEFGQEVWRWRFTDYILKEEYDIYAGTWWNALQRGYYDWTHSNSIWFDSINNVIYLSVRHLSKILKIDYPSGNIIWEMGLPAEFGVGSNNICSELGFSFQHDVKLLDNGNILFFDNGNISHIINNTNADEKISRMLEIEVLDNNCEIIKEKTLPYYCNSMGSVQFLENNNYLINARSDEPYIFEVNSNQNMIWSAYLGNVTFNNYRAFRIPSIHPEAYSVIFDSFENIYLGETKYPGIILLEDKNYINLTINNKSELTQDFYYHFSDNMNWFENIADTITIEANDSATLTFEKKYIYPIYDDFTEVNFTINPIHHEYSKKEFNFYAMTTLNEVLEDFSIIKIFPNPFNSSTQIIFDVPYESDIKFQIYNSNGQLIETLANKTLISGRYMLNWNAEKYSSGVYFLKMNSQNFNQTKKMTLIK